MNKFKNKNTNDNYNDKDSNNNNNKNSNKNNVWIPKKLLGSKQLSGPIKLLSVNQF